jgi:uncharacterized membrane protein YkvA (DUF1232 family)
VEAKKLKNQVYTLYYACRHPSTPWYAKAAAVIVVGYAMSPVDLIPDYIPVLGYLDDLILVPLGIWCVLKLIPPAIIDECRQKVEQNTSSVTSTKNWAAAGIIISLWILAAVVSIKIVLDLFL